jgi:hypothetical protein
VDETNQAYENSQVNARVRLVYRSEINYTESTSFSTNLSRLRSRTDGFIDQVHTIRDTFSADMVSLWVTSSGACGIGYLMQTLSPDFESSAFTVANWTCATGYYTFGHELGHNQGCHHDWANAGGTALYPYSYGWRWMGQDGNTYRSIMAYSPGTRVQHFSNPDVLYQGVRTGVPIGSSNAAHNAQTITNSAPTVHHFRSRLPGDANRDGCVDDTDLAAVVFAFGSKEPLDADVTDDGIVDDSDLSAVVFNFGEGC